MAAAAVMFAIGLRVGARRPDVWLAFAATLACGAALATGRGLATAPIAIACGVLVALAATGNPAGTAVGISLPSAARWSRLVWPLAGAALVAGLGGVAGAWPAAVIAAAGIGATAVRQAWDRYGARWSMLTEHDAVERASRGGGMHGRWEPFMAQGWLARAAMVTTLVAMVACYFLDADQAGWYAVVSAVWFIVLTLADTPLSSVMGGDAARDLLVRSAAGPAPASPAVPRPGTLPFAVRAVAAQGALLAWPACVAAVLWRGGLAHGDGPLAAIAVLAALAVVTVGTLAVTAACRSSGGTTRAAVACALAVAIAAILPRLPASPSLRGLFGPEAGIGLEVDIEGLQPSCKTPHVAQSTPASWPSVTVTGGPFDGVEKSGQDARY